MDSTLQPLHQLDNFVCKTKTLLLLPGLVLQQESSSSSRRKNDDEGDDDDDLQKDAQPKPPNCTIGKVWTEERESANRQNYMKLELD